MGQISENHGISDNLAKKDFLANPEEYIQGLLEKNYYFPYKDIYSSEHEELGMICDTIFTEVFQKVIDAVTLGLKSIEDYTFIELLYHCFWNIERTQMDYGRFVYKLSQHYHYLRYYFIVRKEDYDLNDVRDNYVEISTTSRRILELYKEHLRIFFEGENEKFAHETDPCLVEIREKLNEVNPNLGSNFFRVSSINYSDLEEYGDCHVSLSGDANMNLEQKIVSEEVLREVVIPKLQNILTTLETFVPCDLVFMDNTVYLTLHFRNLQVTNERGDLTTVESLYYFAPVALTRQLLFSSNEERINLAIGREIRGYVNKHKISDTRVPSVKKDFNDSKLLRALKKDDFNEFFTSLDNDDIVEMFGTMYQHSHLSAQLTTSSPNSFCIGQGDIYEALKKFQEENDFTVLDGEELENTISYYFYLVNSYIEYESVTGVPYIYISEKQSLKNAMMILSSEEEKKVASIVYKKSDTQGNIRDHANLVSYLKAIKDKEITTENAIEFFLDSYGSTLTESVRRRLARRTKVFSCSTEASATVRRVMNITREEIMKVCIEIDFQRNTLSSLNFYKDVLGEVTIFQTEKNVTLIQDLFMNLFKLRHLVLGIYSLMENMQKGIKYKEPGVVFLKVTNHFLPKEIKEGFLTKFKLDFEGTYKFFYENFESIFSIYEEEMNFLFCAELLISEEKQQETKKGIAKLLDRYKQITNRYFNGAQEKEIAMNTLHINSSNGVRDFYFKGEQVKRIIVDDSSELCEELAPLIEETPEQEEQHITDIINKVKQIPPVFTEGFIKQLEDELSK